MLSGYVSKFIVLILFIVYDIRFAIGPGLIVEFPPWSQSDDTVGILMIPNIGEVAMKNAHKTPTTFLVTVYSP
jgi:hypothetical protein